MSTQIGGFKKRFKGVFSSNQRGPNDCAACVLNFFGIDKATVEQLYTSAIQNGGTNNDSMMEEMLKEIKGSVVAQYKLDEQQKLKVTSKWDSYPGVLRDKQWHICEKQIGYYLDIIYGQMTPGYLSIVTLRRSDSIGHAVAMGLDTVTDDLGNFLEVIVCPQSGRNPRGRNEVMRYLIEQNICGLDIVKILYDGIEFTGGTGSLVADIRPGMIPRTSSDDAAQVAHSEGPAPMEEDQKYMRCHTASKPGIIYLLRKGVWMQLTDKYSDDDMQVDVENAYFNMLLEILEVFADEPNIPEGTLSQLFVEFGKFMKDNYTLFEPGGRPFYQFLVSMLKCVEKLFPPTLGPRPMIEEFKKYLCKVIADELVQSLQRNRSVVQGVVQGAQVPSNS